MDKAKAVKKQSGQVATSKSDDAQSKTDECAQLENNDGGDTEDVFSSDSQSTGSATSPPSSIICLRVRMR